MPFINLIQEQRQEARRQENRARLFFMSFVGSAVLSVGVLGLLMFENEVAHSEEAALLAKAQKLEPLSKRIEANNNDYADLSPRLATLENAQLVTGRWSRILDHLSRQTPEATWLTGLRCSASDPTKPVQVTFAGLSEKQELIGDFILRLQSCPDLANVALRFTDEKPAANTHDIEFEITSDVQGTAEEVKDEVKKESGE